MTQPLISVIVPCYNVEEYLPKCVESILNQTYRNLEIFLVDDGSPDRSGEICDEYAAMDERIKVIHKENGGLSDARNVALDVMSGEYVTFVDSDDYVTPDYVEVLYGLIEKHQAQMSVVWHHPFSEGTEPQVRQFPKVEKVFVTNEALVSMFYQKDFDTAAWAKLYHCSLFGSDIRYPKGWLYEDLPTTYQLIRRCNKVAFRNRVALFYLLRKNSIEGAPFKSQKYESCVNILDQLEQDCPSFDREVRNGLVCRMVSFAFHILLEIPTDRVEMRESLLSVIKKYRGKVLTDGKARRKARMACLLSYGGMWLVDRFARYGKSR